MNETQIFYLQWIKPDSSWETGILIKQNVVCLRSNKFH
jgi:hypothetical protein